MGMKFDNIEKAAAYSPTVHINEETYKGSKRKDSGHCLIATSLAYSIPGATRLDITADRAKFNYEGYRFTFDLPPKVGAIAVKFDNTGARPKSTVVRLKRPSVRRVESRPKLLKAKKRRKYGTGPYALGKDKPRKTCQRFKARRWHGLKVNPLLVAA
jgi:hypothetical protein